jgi:hypothetical protein
VISDCCLRRWPWYLTIDSSEKLEAETGPLAVLSGTSPHDQRESRREAFRDETQTSSELHRQLTPALASIVGDAENRWSFIAAMNKDVSTGAERLKERASKGIVNADILIAGGGVTAAIFAAQVRADRPDAVIYVIDKNHQLGGQFMNYGTRPVFGANSRNFRPQSQTLGLPGTTGNINSFGDKAPLQIPDFTQESTANNILFGTAAETNLFLSVDEAIPDANVEGFSPATGNATGGELTVKDLENGSFFTMRAPQIVLAGGLGERKSLPQQSVWTAEELFSHFGDERNDFPMDMFVNKRIAVIGAGDTGRIVSRLFTWLASREAYGKSTVQMGGPKGLMVRC